MKKNNLMMIFFIAACPQFLAAGENSLLEAPNKKSTWAVVGAGPAGILTIGMLLDLGVEPKNIFWIDPFFDVGRMGKYYTTVPGNAKTQMYIDFINGCKSFQDCESNAINALYSYDPQVAYPLHVIVDPLIDLTAHLCSKVIPLKTCLTSLDFVDNLWRISLQDKDPIFAYSVVLATGSHPRTLSYPCKDEIPLDQALNKSILAKLVVPSDSVAVIGSSHSAILLLKFLSELHVHRILNFYTKPLEYTIDMGTWLLHSDGLKGSTAEWAKNVLEKNPPKSIIRILSNNARINKLIPTCNKIIYACGFERNSININGSSNLSYDDHSGALGHRLFGIGIAFPEKFTDPLGNEEYRVGLKFFLEYAQRVMPEWVKRETYCRYALFDTLFIIDIL